MEAARLVVRQAATTTTDVFGPTSTRNPDGFRNEDGRFVPFWYTHTGYIVKWSVFLGLLTIFTLYITIGYTHAKRRMRKGLPPLAYHRWLINRNELARVDPRYAYPQANYNTYQPNYYPQQPGGYGMHPMPPPVYDPNAQRPPMYDGPQGATKTAPSQWTQEPTSRPENQQTGADYTAPPPGPPPSAVTANHTGSSNPFRG